MYPGRDGYDFVMGCNIPWAEVDGLTLIDVSVARYYATHIPNCKFFLPNFCWNVLKEYKHSGIKTTKYIIDSNRFGRIIEDPKDLYSSGHMAALELIRLGATEIDIYGCDSYFNYTIESSTWEHVPSLANKNRQAEQIKSWKHNWDLIKSQNKVIIDFIGS